MIVTCPNCWTRFRLDAAALGSGGRRVKCRRCAHIWHQDPQGEADADVVVTAPAPPPPELEAAIAVPDVPAPSTGEPAAASPETHRTPESLLARRPGGDRPPASRSPSGRRHPVRATLLIALMLVAGIGLGGYLARDHIIQVYPDAAELFALFLTSPDPPGAGLALGKLESERRREDGVPILVIRGEIANPSIRPRDVPQLKGALYGADGQELQSWRFTAPEEKLLAGETVRFQTEVRNPPVKATDLKISFVTE